jgi:hypothetical protein
MMPIVLPVFRGYTVDVRLREFRKISRTEPWEFIPFDSPKGRRLLRAWARSIPRSELTYWFNR